jgi:hypothetical protein
MIAENKEPRQRKAFLGYTWVGWLNIILLQWFFIRLAELQYTETGQHISWHIAYGIVPLTGWCGNHVFFGKEMKYFPELNPPRLEP